MINMDFMLENTVTAISVWEYLQGKNENRATRDNIGE